MKTTNRKDAKKVEPKTRKSLRLAKETLRTLVPEELANVVGGYSTGSRYC